MNKIEKIIATIVASIVILIFLGSLVLGIFALLGNNPMLAIKCNMIAIIIFVGGCIL